MQVRDAGASAPLAAAAPSPAADLLGGLTAAPAAATPAVSGANTPIYLGSAASLLHKVQVFLIALCLL